MRTERFIRLAKRNAPLQFAQAEHFDSTFNFVIVINGSVFLRPMSLIQNIFHTSLGRKYLMAISGAGLFGFVVMHMLGNLTIFLGPAAINQYASKLHSLGPLLWIARIGLLGMIGIHIWAAIKLSLENKWARKVSYTAIAKPVDSNRKREIISKYASRTMAFSGIIVFSFILYHLAHYTIKVPEINGTTTDFEKLYVHKISGPNQIAFVTKHIDDDLVNKKTSDVYQMLVSGFSVWWVSLFYLISVGLLCVHLSHGLNAMFQSLGIKTPKSEILLEKFAFSAGLFIFLGYASIPISVYFGLFGIVS